MGIGQFSHRSLTLSICLCETDLDLEWILDCLLHLLSNPWDWKGIGWVSFLFICQCPGISCVAVLCKSGKANDNLILLTFSCFDTGHFSIYLRVGWLEPITWLHLVGLILAILVGHTWNPRNMNSPKNMRIKSGKFIKFNGGSTDMRNLSMEIEL